VPWVIEADIYNPFDNAVAKLNDLQENKSIADFVNVQKAHRQTSEAHLANVGTIESRQNSGGGPAEIPVDGFYEHHDDNIAYDPPVEQDFSAGAAQLLSLADAQYYSNFVPQERSRFMDTYANDNQYVPDGIGPPAKIFRDGGIRVAHWHLRKKNLATAISRCTLGQRTAFDGVCARLDTGDFSASFVSGDGGTGKSYLVRLLQEHCRLKFGKSEGAYGPSVVLGPTGCAAHNVNGFTWQSALGLGMLSKPGDAMTMDTKLKVGRRLKGVKLLILDEISLVSAKNLNEIEIRIKQGT
jgi:hypothetical protein